MSRVVLRKLIRATLIKSSKTKRPRSRSTVKKKPKDPPPAPNTPTYEINKYFLERARVELILDKNYLDMFNFHMDVLEAFMCHCKPEGSEPVSQLLVLVLTAYLCSVGEDKSFPNSILPMVLNKASAGLCEVICTNSLSNEFEKIALFSASALLQIFKTAVSESVRSAR